MKCKVTYRVLRKKEEVWIKKVGIQQGQQQWCQKVGRFQRKNGEWILRKTSILFQIEIFIIVLFTLGSLILKTHHH